VCTGDVLNLIGVNIEPVIGEIIKNVSLGGGITNQFGHREVFLGDLPEFNVFLTE
jgi:hypothetical protein